MEQNGKTSGQANLVEFMYSKLGGKERVYQEYVKGRLFSAVSGGTTVGQLLEIAEKEGWLETLKGIPFESLLGLKKTPEKKERVKRATPEEKDAIKGSIIKVLTNNPWSNVGDIVAGVGKESQRVRPLIAVLKKDGQIKATGSKAAMVYAVKGEKTKPATA